MQKTPVTSEGPSQTAESVDYLDGIDAIAEFLSETLGRPWTPRQARYARETGALPIRMKRGVGVYAFRSELLAALRGPDSLPRNSLRAA